MRSTLFKMAQRGFTLIELMVVVAIIGILAAMAMSAYTGATAKARNAKLKGNVKAMQSAVEQTYDAILGVYNSVDGSKFASGAVPDGVSITYNGTVGTTASKYCIVSEALNTTADSVNHGANCTGGAAGSCTFTASSPTMYCAANIQ